MKNNQMPDRLGASTIMPASRPDLRSRSRSAGLTESCGSRGRQGLEKQNLAELRPENTDSGMVAVLVDGDIPAFGSWPMKVYAKRR